MFKIIKEHYSIIIIFILILFKEQIYKLIDVKENVYTPVKCELLEREYNKLLEFNNIDVTYNTEFINSYIIYKDIYNYMNEITINGGENQNFSRNPIIYDNTLIGVISKVNDNSSIVKLVTNKDSKISVKINEEVGILEYENGKLLVNNISNYSNITIGDVVYTSGLGNIHENIFIGTVKNISLDNKGIEKNIEVDYKLKIKDIDYVTVLGVSKWYFCG